MILLLIAHLLGDWVFQSRKVAVEKGKQNFDGWFMCLFHVSLYTFIFTMLVRHQSLLFYVSIFVPHFLIDKWSLMSKWQKLRDGKYWYEIYTDTPYSFMQRVEAGFAALRYAVEDNTIHLICLYLSWKYLGVQTI